MKNLLLVLVAVLCSSYGFSQEITGSWNGKINVQGTTLPLIFKIEKAETGYKSTLTSPLQSPMALVSTMTAFENNKSTLTSPRIPYRIKIKVYNTYIPPVLLYGRDCINWTIKLLQKVEAFQNHIM